MRVAADSASRRIGLLAHFSPRSEGLWTWAVGPRSTRTLSRYPVSDSACAGLSRPRWPGRERIVSLRLCGLASARAPSRTSPVALSAAIRRPWPFAQGADASAVHKHSQRWARQSRGTRSRSWAATLSSTPARRRSRWGPLTRTDFEFVKELGSGAYGIVWCARHGRHER